MTENERSVHTPTPSMQQIVIVAVASVLLISTVAFSQYALASSYDGQDVLRTSFNTVNPTVTDLDVEEAAEAENATIVDVYGNNTDVQFLFIQRAQSGSLNEINATAYTLELKNVSDSTIMFADRPNRIVTSISTSDFVGNWTAGSDSFAADAPNDALIVEDIQTGELETAIIESFNPVYDTNTNTLTYTIVAENGTSIDLPSQFGQSILVIDFAGCLATGGDCGGGLTCDDPEMGCGPD